MGEQFAVVMFFADGKRRLYVPRGYVSKSPRTHLITATIAVLGRDSLQHGTPPVPRGSTCTYSAFAGRPQHSAQNLPSKDGGARDWESAIASNAATRTVPRFRPALPSRGNRISVVSLEEAQRSAAAAIYASPA